MEISPGPGYLAVWTDMPMAPRFLDPETAQPVAGLPGPLRSVTFRTSYATQVNFTPATPAGPWTALPTGSSRRRVVTAPTQGAQFLAQVAAIASDGTQSAWSEPILAIAR